MKRGDVLVGRSDELDVLSHFLDQVLEGQRQVILLSGEPGIGKSALAQEVARAAAERGASVLWGRSWESGGAPPLWPWIQILRSGFAHESVPDIRKTLGGPTEVLEHLVAAAPTSPSEEASMQSRFTIFDAVGRFLHELAERDPLVLIFEDVHAADATSLHLLEFLAKGRPDTRLLLVATFRHAEAESRPEIDDVLAEIEREGLRLHLTGLVPADCAAVMSSLRPGSTELDGEELHRVTGGNPLYLRQLSRASGDVMHRRAGIRSAIRRHVAQAPEEVRRLLRHASVIGREVEVGLLLEMGEEPAEAVRGALGRAASEGFIRLADERDEFSFSHDLVRQALYEELPDEDRSLLHRRAAHLLEKLHGDKLDGYVSLIARHYAAAGSGVEAVPYLQRSADLAIHRFAYESAVEDLETALGLVDPDDAETRADILIALGQALRAIGSDSYAERLLEAVKLSARIGDPVRESRAYAMMIETSIPAVYARDEELVQGIERSLRILPRGNDALRIRLLVGSTFHLNRPEEQDRRERARQEAMSLARELDDPLLIAEALRGHLGSLLFEETDGAPLSEELLELVQPLKQDPRTATWVRARELEMGAWRHRCSYVLEAGDALGFQRAAAQILAGADELGQPRYLVAAESVRTVQAFMLGRLEEVLQRADRVLEMMPNELLVLAMHSVQKGFALYELERGLEMEELYRSMLIGMPDLHGFRILLALGYIQEGRREEAIAIMGPIFANLSSVPRDASWLPFMCGSAMVARDVDRPSTCDDIAELIQPYLGRHCVINMSQPAFYLGPVSFYIGLCAAGANRWEDAMAHCERAVVESEDIGAPLWSAKARYELARISAASSDVDGVRKYGEAALRFARQMKVPYLARCLHELLAEDQASSEGLELARDGDVWQIRSGRGSFRVNHIKGMDYLARLLESPGKELHALELAGVSAPSNTPRTSHADDLHAEGGAVAMLDEKAMAQYKRRISELQEEIEDAEANNDPERGSRAKEELDFLLAELSASTGLGGRARGFNDPAERARVAVTKSIRRAIDRVAEHDRSVADHLRRSVTTGLFCSYTPSGSEGHTSITVIR